MPFKAFHCRIHLDPHPAENGHPLPSNPISKETVSQTFLRIHAEAKQIVGNRLAHMRNNAKLNKLILNPKVGARRRKQTKL